MKPAFEPHGIHGFDAVRFWNRVEWSEGCWLWQGAIDKGGYGRLIVARHPTKHKLAHRMAYELAVEPIPAGLEIDHLCRVRRCVNPAHLEPVTTRVNVLRSNNPMGVHGRKTHCNRGHAFEGEALVLGDGGRRCRICRRLMQNALKKRQRAEVRSAARA